MIPKALLSVHTYITTLFRSQHCFVSNIYVKMTVASFNTQNQSDTYNERARREFKPPTYLTMLTVAPDSTVFHVFSLLAMCTTVSFFVFLMYVCRVLIKITYLLTYLLYRVRQKHFCGDDNTTLRLFSASSDIPRHSLLSSKLR